MRAPITSKLISTLAACLLSAGAAFAQAPASSPPATQSDFGVKIGKFFNEQQKQAARKVFTQKYAKGKECPEGMAQKGKSCASPWDQRYWAIGQALQPAVKVYPGPEPVVAILPAAPKGYEYVRAADDILLIASGSKLVVDMIEHVTS